MKFKKEHVGSSLEDFLQDQGILESATAKAVKSVTAWRFGKQIKEQRTAEQRLADLMRTRRGGS
jgi:hypothetical protein